MVSCRVRGVVQPVSKGDTVLLVNCSLCVGLRPGLATLIQEASFAIANIFLAGLLALRRLPVISLCLILVYSKSELVMSHAHICKLRLLFKAPLF